MINSMPEPAERKTYTVTEVGEMLGLSKNLAYLAAKNNKLPVPVFRVGKRLLISKSAMDAYLESTPQPTSPALDIEAAEEMRANRRVPVKCQISPQMHAELLKRANRTGRSVAQELEMLLEIGLMAQRMMTP
jgi:excisionase family DNA binding protein